jgi:hypothetical protein
MGHPVLWRSCQELLTAVVEAEVGDEVSAFDVAEIVLDEAHDSRK